MTREPRAREPRAAPAWRGTRCNGRPGSATCAGWPTPHTMASAAGYLCRGVQPWKRRHYLLTHELVGGGGGQFVVPTLHCSRYLSNAWASSLKLCISSRKHSRHIRAKLRATYVASETMSQWRREVKPWAEITYFPGWPDLFTTLLTHLTTLFHCRAKTAAIHPFLISEWVWAYWPTTKLHL